MHPSRINNPTSTTNHQIEQGEASNSTQPPAHVFVQGLASHLHQITGHHLQQVLVNSNDPVQHIVTENDREENFRIVLSLWMGRLPVEDRKAGNKIAQQLLRKKSNQKSLTLELSVSELPEFFGFFKNLENIDISTSAEKLPESIALAKKLKTLILRSKTIKSLPDSMGSLENLTSITLTECHKITELPHTMSQLPKLTTFGVISSSATNPLPNNIDSLKNIQIFYVNNCESFGNSALLLKKIEKLRKLIIYRTPISQLQINQIKNIKQITTLEISSNQTLTELPDDFFEKSKIIDLSLKFGAAFRRLPSSINQLVSLKKLDISDCTAFEELPEEIGDLRALKSLDANYCRSLRSLPQSIVNLASNCQIDLERTGLSIHLIENLSRQTELRSQQTNGSQGPTIQFSLPESATEPVGTLSEEILKWKRETVDTSHLSSLETQHLEQLDESSAIAMATLLARFRKTAQYQRNPKGTAQRIHSMLSELLTYPDVLTSFCAMALESNATCDDRTALGLLHIELALLENKLLQTALTQPYKTQTYHMLHEAAQGIFKQRRLMDIAHTHAKNAKGFVDETEIVLKYLTSLSTPLNLPAQLHHMLYERYAWQVTPENIDTAKQELQNFADLEQPRFLDFLADWHPWQAAFKHHDPEKNETLDNQLEQIDMNSLNKLEALREKYNHACQHEEAGELSEQALSLKHQINQTQLQRHTERMATWHPYILDALTHYHSEDEVSTSHANKRPRVHNFF